MKTALYVGSFNPLHHGHIDIAIQAANCFDKVIIVKAQNTLKEDNLDFNDAELEDLSVLPSWCSTHYRPKDTIVGLVKEFKPDVVVKGLRNSYDLLESQNYVYSVREMCLKGGMINLPFEFVFFFPTTADLLFVSSTNERHKKAAGCLHKR